jgi:hypothetical protein
MTETVRLYRPTGPEELALVEQSNWESWPPRLSDQPIFYPVLNEDYANKIAKEWNAKFSGTGYVTTFLVEKEYLDKFQVQQVGGKTILEYWIPAEELEEFNKHVVGKIIIINKFTKTVD